MDERSRREQERYLDEGTPPVDPEVGRLEGLLGRYRHRGEGFVFPEGEAGLGLGLGHGRNSHGLSRVAAVDPGGVGGGGAVGGVRCCGPAWGGAGAAGAGLCRARDGRGGAAGAWALARERRLACGDRGRGHRRGCARPRRPGCGRGPGRARGERALPRARRHGGLDLGRTGRLPGRHPGGTVDRHGLHLPARGRLERRLRTWRSPWGRWPSKAEGRTVFVPEDYFTYAAPGRGPVVPLPILVDPDVEELVRRVERAAEVSAEDVESVRSLGGLGDALPPGARARAGLWGRRPWDALLELEQLPESWEGRAGCSRTRSAGGPGTTTCRGGRSGSGRSGGAARSG